jgi:hypothetical protein
LISEGAECLVFDVVFHPDTLTKSKVSFLILLNIHQVLSQALSVQQISQSDPAFRQFVVDISIQNICRKSDLAVEPSMRAISDVWLIHPMRIFILVVRCTDFTLPKMQYKGQGPPRVQHIKKSGILKKPLVELVDDQPASTTPASTNKGSEFKINFDDLHKKSRFNGEGKSATSIPTVSSLLEKRNPPATSSSQAAPTHSVKTQNSVSPVSSSTSIMSPISDVIHSHTQFDATSVPSSACSQHSKSPATQNVANSHEWSMDQGVRCQMFCPSLSSSSSSLIPFDSSQWDHEVFPDELHLNIHLPMVV